MNTGRAGQGRAGQDIFLSGWPISTGGMEHGQCVFFSGVCSKAYEVTSMLVLCP